MKRLLLALLLVLAPCVAHGAALSLLKGQTCADTTPRPCLVNVFVQDSSSTTGAGLTGLTNASSSLVCYYMRTDQGNAGATQLTLSGGTLGTWSSGGFKEKDSTNAPGEYELGLSTAMLATGSNFVRLHCKGATNMAPVVVEYQLTNYDPQNSTNLGLTLMPSNVTQWNGSAVATPNVSGVPKVDVVDYLGVAAAPQADSGTLAAGSASGGTLAANSGTNVASLFLGGIVYATGGTIPAPRWCTITGYTAGRVFTCSRNWSVNPDATTTYVVLTAAPVIVDSPSFPTNFASQSIDSNGAVKIQAAVKKNTALATFMFLMTDSTTHAPKTGVTATCTRSIDGGAFGAGTLANVAEVASGFYKVDFGAGDLNGNNIVLRCTGASSDDAFVTLVTYP